MGDTNDFSTKGSKYSDSDINNLNFSILKFVPESNSYPTTYFDFSGIDFDSSTARPRTPYALTESDALAGNWQLDSCNLYTVVNFGRGHCSSTVKSAYGYKSYGGTPPASGPVVGTSGVRTGAARLYVYSALQAPTSSPTDSPVSPTGSPTQEGVLLMKLKAGSDVFKYESSYWTNDNTYDEGTHATSKELAVNSDAADTKLEAFNTDSLSALTLCYKTLDNCFTYHLDKTYSSARELFSAGYKRSDNMGQGSASNDEGKKAFTDILLPPGDSMYDRFWNGGHGNNCAMQRPGINTQCNDNNWARIGYCVNLPDQGCQPSDGNDADSPIGFGLKTQNWPNNVNAPFGEYFLHRGNNEVTSRQHQAWLFAGTSSAQGPTQAPTSSPTDSPVSPTGSPTQAPTSSPTDSLVSPTGSPTQPTDAPTPAPTAVPVASASAEVKTVVASGDPHLVNVRGQRFDLLVPGLHVLLQVPRASRLEETLVRVEADAWALGGHCADMYFQSVNVTGQWARDAAGGGSGMQFFVSAPYAGGNTGWIALGKVDLKVAWGRTPQDVHYLNVFARHLTSTGYAVGGLLGEDDHTAQSTPPSGCSHVLALYLGGKHGREGSIAKVM